MPGLRQAQPTGTFPVPELVEGSEVKVMVCLCRFFFKVQKISEDQLNQCHPRPIKMERGLGGFSRLTQIIFSKYWLTSQLVKG